MSVIQNIHQPEPTSKKIRSALLSCFLLIGCFGVSIIQISW